MASPRNHVSSTLHETKGTLSPAPPFDFAKSLDFVGEFTPTQGSQAVAKGSMTKAVYALGVPVVFRLEQQGTIDEPKLHYTLLSGEPLATNVRDAALAFITSYLGLEDDLRPFYKVGEADPAFKPVLDALYGYHQVKFGTPFEAACWTVLSIRNQMLNARKVKDAFARHFSEPIEVNGTEYVPFPEAGTVAASSPEEIGKVVRDERRAGYLSNVAQAFSTVEPRFLQEASFEDLESWLRGIKGIGDWSAQFILLRGLGRMNNVPLTEKRFVQVVSDRYNNGKPASPTEIEKIAAPYGDWKGYWAHYLRVGG